MVVFRFKELYKNLRSSWFENLLCQQRYVSLMLICETTMPLNLRSNLRQEKNRKVPHNHNLLGRFFLTHNKTHLV